MTTTLQTTIKIHMDFKTVEEREFWEALLLATIGSTSWESRDDVFTQAKIRKVLGAIDYMVMARRDRSKYIKESGQ
jgi:hypothetical protein